MPDNKILAVPNILHLANGVEGSIEVGGSFTLPGIPLGFDIAWWTNTSHYIINPAPAARSFTKDGTDSDDEILSIFWIPRNQTFMFQWFLNTQAIPFSVIVGIRDQLNRFSGVNAFRSGTSARYTVYGNGDLLTDPYNIGSNTDGYMVTSDGNTLLIYRSSFGVFSVVGQVPILPDTEMFKLMIDCHYHGNLINYVAARLDDVVTPVTTLNTAYTLSPPDFGIVRAIDISHFGITAESVGENLITFSNSNISESTTVPVIVDALYLRPKSGTGLVCGGYAITGQVVEFESNGGNGGIFEATSGTILSDLRWQAPLSVGVVEFTYTIGDIHATCLLNVVEKLTVKRVNEDGYYPDLAQGEQVQFESSCPEALFIGLHYPTIITESGHLVAPTDAQDEFFGAKDVKIRVVGCGQSYEFRLHIQAMFPTPKFCGPAPESWTKAQPDFLPTSLIMTGGTSQVKNRNSIGILLWSVEYVSLNQIDSPCGCSKLSHNTGCSFQYENAKRLDDFYLQVKGTVGYFTVVDYHTQIVYKYVRLTSYKDAHNGLYNTEQTRSLTMRQEGDTLFE